jgi:hypothetical protein
MAQQHELLTCFFFYFYPDNGRILSADRAKFSRLFKTHLHMETLDYLFKNIDLVVFCAFKLGLQNETQNKTQTGKINHSLFESFKGINLNYNHETWMGTY